MIDIVLRLVAPNIWENVGKSLGVLVDGDEGVVPAQGANISDIGKIVITPAVLDENGDVITPAVMTTQVHYNVRVTGNEVLETSLQKDYDDAVTANSKAPSNKNEAAYRHKGAQFIDVETISIPTNVWL